jgi:hypothetical protein
MQYTILMFRQAGVHQAVDKERVRAFFFALALQRNHHLHRPAHKRQCED